jgi:hypothetical protein
MGAPHEFHGGEKVSAAPTPFLWGRMLTT